MGRPQTLTKEWLQAHHIVDVSKEGVITAMTRQGERYTINPTVASKKSRWKVQQYHLVGIYDTEEWKRQKEAYKDRGTQASGVRQLVLSRVIWAWWNGECPAGMDVDHINGNSLDDRLDNLQLLTRKENLAKRAGYRNQYEKSKVLDDNAYYKELVSYVKSVNETKKPEVTNEEDVVFKEAFDNGVTYGEALEATTTPSKYEEFKKQWS